MKPILYFISLMCIWAQQHVHRPATEKPVALLEGMGQYGHSISTRNPQAQKFFDQGLNLLYGFNRYEALRSFRKAAELDSTSAIARWGVAMAQGPHINMDLDGDANLQAYCKELEAARGIGQAAEADRTYVAAALTRCGDGNDSAYIAAMRDLARQYPDDLDAATFLAESLMIPVRWRWWSRDGRPAGGVEEAVQVLEEVMRRNPDHPGANHFYLHAVEMSRSPERAIPSAQRLMGIVPGAGHLVHMPGHIWLLMGDYEIAAATNERAAEVDRQYMAKTGVSSSSYVGYYIHNLHFVAMARAMQGRKADATKAAQVLADSVMPHVETMAEMIDGFAPWPVFAALRFQDWDAVLSMKAPDARLPVSSAILHYGRAIAFHAKGRSNDALAEKKRFGEAVRRVKPEAMWLFNKSADVLAIAEAILEARFASGETVFEWWKKAAQREEALLYDEPPTWYYPVRESWGGALLRAGRANEAETVFREGVRMSRRNGRMLFGLMEALKTQGKQAQAEMVRKEYEAAWRRADVTLKIGDL